MIRIKVVQPSVKTIELDIHQSATVSALKQLIFEKAGFSKLEQRLRYNGDYLYDNDTLQNRGVVNGDTINLEDKPPGWVQVHVITPTGKTIAMEVHGKQMVEDIKAQVQAAIGMHPSQMRLIHGTKALADGTFLENYNIGNDHTITAVIKLDGGQ